MVSGAEIYSVPSKSKSNILDLSGFGKLVDEI